MNHLKVYRSAGREMLLLLAGLLLVMAAIDVVWAHKVAGPPETDDAGALTSRGRSQQRTDYLWGATFLVVGGAIALVGTGGLLVRRPVVEVNDDDLQLRIAGPQSGVSIPWSNISWVHSGSDGEDEAVPPRVFLVHLFDRGHLPDHLWGAAWDGATLMVDADSWNMPTVEVVAHSRMVLDAWRRNHLQSESEQEKST